MTRSELIIRVKTKLDEYAPTGASLPFDDYVGPLLDEAARDLLERAPLHLMTPTSIPYSASVYENEKSYIPVPDDFVRLYEIKYPLWKKSVRTAISRENPEYQIQENEFIKGGYGRPVVAVVTTSVLGGAIDKYLECSKVIDGATPLVATYVKTFGTTLDPENLNDQLADALTWLCSSKVMEILGYKEKAQALAQQFQNSMTLLMA
jgi:hypothetical protein